MLECPYKPGKKEHPPTFRANKDPLDKIKEFYSKYSQEIVPVSSPKVAELVKLFEKTQRLMNISLVNLKRLGS